MLTLISELRFWTLKDEVNIKDTDLGAFKFTEKKLPSNKSLYAEGKKNYIEKRGLKIHPNNKKPTKLKSSLKTLEEELKQRSIVFCQWKDNAIVQIMLSNGLLIHITINPLNGDILRIYFDKYLIGKLVSEQIADVIITKTHILISYNENQITFVQLQKPTVKKNNLEKISLMEPKIFNVIISGPSSRKIPKHLVCNKSLDYIVIWTKSSQNEVYPWRPTVKDSDRANLHVYKLSRNKLELFCYYWTENDPISVEFSNLHEHQLHSVEQKVSKKGDVTIESCIYQINKTKLQRIAVTSIPLQTQVCCNAFSPDHEKLMLGCIDGSIILFDEGRGITHLVKAAFIPTLVAWHSDSALVLIANERCQFQFFDISLSCVKNQLIGEDILPSNVLDLSGYFTFQPNLLKMCWSKKPDISVYYENYTQTDCFLLLSLESGPLSCLRFVGGSGLKGDVHTSGFTADVLVHKYISLHQVEKAINILLSLNWDTYGAMCLISLHRIANYVFKQPLTTEREIQLQKALGSFHVPVKPLCYETEVEFGDQVNDITVRFFHHMLRNKSYDKAFALAIDINDADLFLKLHDRAKSDKELELAEEAMKKADAINRSCMDSDSDHSTCSNTSCSICTDNSEDESGNEEEPLPPSKTNDTNSFKSLSLSSTSSKSNNDNHPPLPIHKKRAEDEYNYMPPLPYFPRNSAVTAFKKVTIPKPELKVSAKKLKEKSLSSSNLLADPMERTHKKSFELLPKSSSKSSYFNSLSVDHLNMNQYSFVDHYNHNAPTANISKPPKALPRTSVLSISSSSSTAQNQHVVIDVVPSPISPSVPSPKANIFNIDQTLGIPILYDDLDARAAKKPSWFSSPSSSSYNNYSTPSNGPTVIHQYPLISGNIPSKIPPKYHTETERKYVKKKDAPHATSSILSNSTNSNPNPAISTAPVASMSSSNNKKESGEKNKVKFSDTVTVAVVPEIPRKEKSGDRIKKSSFYPLITDPRRELAESLPLCHPNEDYLKDFTPMQDILSNDEDDDVNEDKKIPNIKVVHFGVV